MFLKINDLKNSIYNYQIDQITDGDTNITLQAMAAAEEEVRSYLTANNRREWADGRLLYDVDKILSAEGDERNPLIVSHMATIAKYYIVELCNADIIYEVAKERYDRAINWFEKIANGDLNLNTLPVINPEKDDSKDESTFPWTYGSRKKFNHE